MCAHTHARISTTLIYGARANDYYIDMMMKHTCWLLPVPAVTAMPLLRTYQAIYLKCMWPCKDCVGFKGNMGIVVHGYGVHMVYLTIAEHKGVCIALL